MIHQFLVFIKCQWHKVYVLCKACLTYWLNSKTGNKYFMLQAWKCADLVFPECRDSDWLEYCILELVLFLCGSLAQNILHIGISSQGNANGGEIQNRSTRKIKKKIWKVLWKKKGGETDTSDWFYFLIFFLILLLDM